MKGAIDYALEVKITQHSHDSERSLGEMMGPSEPNRLPVNNTDNKLIACRSAPVAAWRPPAPTFTPLPLRYLSPWARDTHGAGGMSRPLHGKMKINVVRQGEIAGANSPPPPTAGRGCNAASRLVG